MKEYNRTWRPWPNLPPEVRLKSCILYTVSTNQKKWQQTLHSFGLQHSVRRSGSNSSRLPKLSTGRDTAVCTATRCGLDGPGIACRWGARLSAPVHTRPGTHPALCTRGSGSLSGWKGVQKPGRGVFHPLPSSAEIKERVEPQLYSPSGPSRPGTGRTLTFSPKLSPGVVFLIIMRSFQEVSK